MQPTREQVRTVLACAAAGVGAWALAEVGRAELLPWVQGRGVGWFERPDLLPGHVAAWLCGVAAAAGCLRLLAGTAAQRALARALGAVLALVGAGHALRALAAVAQERSAPTAALLVLALPGLVLLALAPPRLASGRRRAGAAVLLALLVVGLPTLADAVDLARPKDYAPFVLELRLVEREDVAVTHRGRGRDELRLGADDVRRVTWLGDGRLRFELTEAAGDRMWELTAHSIGRQVAIVLDGRELMVPVIQSGLHAEVVIQAGSSGEGAGSARELFTRLTGQVPD